MTFKIDMQTSNKRFQNMPHLKIICYPRNKVETDHSALQNHQETRKAEGKRILWYFSKSDIRSGDNQCNYTETLIMDNRTDFS